MANNPHDIVPAHLAVQAMRDNGYKNAAYAIAELMDNAIQAGATKVELLCGEKKEMATKRVSSRIFQIAVLDNGSGMGADVLRLALQFGNGTYLDEEKHTGIGRFGMGLPSSSISQCQRVDVWSWQNGSENALHSYLDLNEIKQKKLTEVPEPNNDKRVPDVWKQVSNGFGKTGTLVVWSEIDRCIWKTAKTIIDNSEFLIGRMYRKFLENEQASIRMLAFDIDNHGNKISEKMASPNDPSYLMAKTSCPEPFASTPMFQVWVSDIDYELTFKIDFRDKEHEVKVRFSYAKEEARIPDKHNSQPGNLPHGKHAEKNVGISIIRADRELELDKSLVINEPTERWWGVEVDFPPALDDLFGVTNNKQTARNFAELVKIDPESLLEDGRSMAQFKEELKENDDPRESLLAIIHRIRKNISSLRSLLKNQNKGTGTPRNQRHNIPFAEKVATTVTEKRKEEGHPGQSDKDEALPKAVRQETIELTLKDQGVAEIKAKELAASIVDDGLKFNFTAADLETAAFFSVKSRGGAIIVTLNTNHAAYKNLVEILEKDLEGADTETLKSRLINSLDGLKLLLMAWARYEDEQPEGKRKDEARNVRHDWGLIAQEFLEQNE